MSLAVSSDFGSHILPILSGNHISSGTNHLHCIQIDTDCIDSRNRHLKRIIEAIIGGSPLIQIVFLS